MGYNVYCYKHQETHNLPIEDLKKLIHIYQHMAADFAYSAPLPTNEASHADVVLGRIWCPVDDLGVVAPDLPPSKIRSYVRSMVRWSKENRRKSRKRVDNED